VKETGRISKIDGKMITVFCGEIAACFGCMSQECKSNKRVITAENRNQLDLSVGQFVEIETSVSSACIQFLQAIIPPIVGFAAAYFLMTSVFLVSDYGIRVAAGVIGLFLAGFGFYVFRKKFPVRNNPRVVRFLDISGV
jgi:sigma-E factor negative regulatory protein RseC